MMGGMPPAKTSGNRAETESDPLWEIVARLSTIEKKLDHLDDYAHTADQKITALTEFIDLHKPALARGLALMDPGAKVRAMLPSRKAKV
jgi:hypothetical protein